MDERKTRFNKALQGSFDDVDVFTNINEIKKLAGEIKIVDVLILVLLYMERLPNY